MKIYAVVPARSGSKGLPHKNVKVIDNKPLLSYSIAFAHKLQGVSRVFCSTDSESYAELARKYGAEVPFLRSREASVDTAMEQDILKDMREQFKEHGIEEPDIIVWLRPTFVFRNLGHVNSCINKLVDGSDYSSARTVVNAETRLYEISDNGILTSSFDDGCKSMVRRQDLPDKYKVFSTDVFRFKGNRFGDDFLGARVFAVKTDKVCGLDIDDDSDFEIVKSIIESNAGFIHEYL